MRMPTNFKLIDVIFVLMTVFLTCTGTCTAKSSLAVLKIPTGARSIALGGAYCAVAEGKDTLHYNPAGIVYASKGIDVGLSHINWLKDVNLQELATIIAINPQISVAIQYLSLKQGEIEAYDELAHYIDKYSADSSIFAVGVGVELLPEILYFGGILRRITEKIEKYEGRGRTLDLGVLFTPVKNLNFGLSLQNFGPKVKFVKEADPIAKVIRIGAMKRFKNILAAVDIVHSTYPKSIYPAFGVEYNIRRWGLNVAGGFNMNKKSDFGNSLSFGVNYFGLRNILLSYSFLSGKRLGGTHRFDFSACLSDKPLIKYLPKPPPREELPQKEERKEERKESEVLIDYEPQASCYASLESFFPRIESVTFFTEASDDVGIVQWALWIYDSEGNIVREFCGTGMPPKKITWDGKDNDGRLLPPDTYIYIFSVIDTRGNKVYTPQKTVKLIGF